MVTGGTFGSDGEISDRRARGVTVIAVPGSSTWLQEFPASVLVNSPVNRGYAEIIILLKINKLFTIFRYRHNIMVYNEL